MLETIICIILAPLAFVAAVFLIGIALGIIKGFAQGFNKGKRE